MPVVKWRGARGSLTKITNIWVYKFSKSKSTAIKHVYNQSANLIASYVIHFDINGPSNHSGMAPVIGTKSMVARACFRYTWYFLRPAYVARLSPQLGKSWCHISPTCIQSSSHVTISNSVFTLTSDAQNSLSVGGIFLHCFHLQFYVVNFIQMYHAWQKTTEWNLTYHTWYNSIHVNFLLPIFRNIDYSDLTRSMSLIFVRSSAAMVLKKGKYHFNALRNGGKYKRKSMFYVLFIPPPPGKNGLNFADDIFRGIFIISWMQCFVFW